MRKYWAFFRISFQDTITYRGPMVVWLLSMVIGGFTGISMWLAAKGGDLLGGYTKRELISYYVIGMLFHWMTNWFPFYSIINEIKEGTILTSLLRPFSFYWRKFFEELGWHTVSFLVGLMGSLVFVIALRDLIIFNLSLGNILLVSLSLVLTIFLTFSFSLCMGMTSFWFLEIWALDSLFWICRLIIGGQGIPISFIPAAFQPIVKILPFRYMYSFPLEVYFGKVRGVELVYGFIIQIGWIIGLFFLYKLMWQKGRKAYTAFGQ